MFISEEASFMLIPRIRIGSSETISISVRHAVDVLSLLESEMTISFCEIVKTRIMVMNKSVLNGYVLF